MTWREWKKQIRALLDAEEAKGTFNIDTDDLAYFDIVSGEGLELRRHKSLSGLASSPNQEEVEEIS